MLISLKSFFLNRCPQSKANSCVEGCKFSGSFNGKIPADFPNLQTANLMHDALSSFNKQAQTTQNDRVGGGRLLCLDGGGIRGIVLTQMLIVIEQVSLLIILYLRILNI
jgi:hypothetical protein